MIKNIFNLRFFFQFCWNCSCPTWSLNTLCNNCFSKLEIAILSTKQKTQVLETFPILYLTLLDNNSDIPYQWILSLKKAKCHRSNFAAAADLLVQKMIISEVRFSDWVFITSPSLHSYHLTQALSSNLGIEFYYELYEPEQKNIGFLQIGKTHQKSQKKLNIIERRLRDYVWRGPEIQHRKVIFVDDVVTTGSTAVAAWEAVGKPKDFLILCLGYRPKLK